MLVYWVPLIVVLLLRAFRSHFRVRNEGGFVTMTPLAEVHPALDRAVVP